LFSGLGIGQIVNRTRLTEGVDSEGTHPLLLGLVNRRSSPIQRNPADTYFLQHGATLDAMSTVEQAAIEI